MQFRSIYDNKNTLKAIIGILAIIIGGFSIWYTGELVEELTIREQKTVALYAKALQTVAVSEGESAHFIFSEIIEGNTTIPVVMTDSAFNVLSHKNVEITGVYNEEDKKVFFQKLIERMRAEHEPVVVKLSGFTTYIFYRNSKVLYQLKNYPFIQTLIFIGFGTIAYLAFSYSRRMEQNRVWVGMAKETAHQIGTPLSALMAWIEVLKSGQGDKDVFAEMEKDILRLQIVTERFSGIGSMPKMQVQAVEPILSEIRDYFAKRAPRGVEIRLETEDHGCFSAINKPLLTWVLENLIRNAIDALEGPGIVLISCKMQSGKIKVEVKDTGKGMTQAQVKKVFRPGYTTKARGWGLGLTLSKRIIEEYHQGKILVAESEPWKGTTFRIWLKPEKQPLAELNLEM